MSVLEIRNISKSFTTGFINKRIFKVLKDISFSVEENEILGLAGTSGAGKSTLIRIIMQLLKPDQGDILLNGKVISQMSANENKKMREDMQLVFQNPTSSLNPRMTIKESIEEPIRIHKNQDINLKHSIEDVLEKVQLRKELLSRYPHQLSGGELQRICLARLLLLNPKILLLDEPTSMLDVSVQAQIISILKDIQKERSLACLFISHDLDLLRVICNRIGIMREGRLIELQPTELLYRHPKEKYTKELLAAFEDF